jgi:hypothetical protein
MTCCGPHNHYVPSTWMLSHPRIFSFHVVAFILSHENEGDGSCNRVEIADAVIAWACQGQAARMLPNTEI